MRAPNPFAAGQQITVPAGTPLVSMDPRHPGRLLTRRARTVIVYSVDDGYAEQTLDGCRIVLPTVVWPGGGGYWQYASVTASVCAANRVPPVCLTT